MPDLKLTLKPNFSKNDIPVDQWKVTDFVKYFSALLSHNGYPPLAIPPRAWAAYGGRVKQFLGKAKITNQQYKIYLEFLFSPRLRAANFIPNFSAAISFGSYYKVVKLLGEESLLTQRNIGSKPKSKVNIHYSDDYFRSLAAELKEES